MFNKESLVCAETLRYDHAQYRTDPSKPTLTLWNLANESISQVGACPKKYLHIASYNVRTL